MLCRRLKSSPWFMYSLGREIIYHPHRLMSHPTVNPTCNFFPLKFFEYRLVINPFEVENTNINDDKGAQKVNYVNAMIEHVNVGSVEDQ